MSFRFTVCDDPPEDGYSLGDLEVCGIDGSVSTRGMRSPDQRMMVYLAAEQLLFESRRLAESGKGQGAFEGIGSEFVVQFSLQKGKVETRRQRTRIDLSPLGEFLDGVEMGVKEIYEHGVESVLVNRRPVDRLGDQILSFNRWRSGLADGRSD